MSSQPAPAAAPPAAADLETTAAADTTAAAAPAAPAAASRGRRTALLAAFVASVFLSAFLLFLVQPMFGRMVLPLLGGSPAVWNTCMLFFQAALLGGYLYAHVSSRRLGVRRQAALHLALLVLTGLLLPVSVAGAAPEGGSAPIPWLLLLMLTTVGPPFLVLSATGPMLQRWFSRSGHPGAADPYWLYAASNLGSMLGLLGYPFFLEPRLRLAEQSTVWAIGYGVLAALIAGCAALVWRTADDAAPATAAATEDTAGGTEEAGARVPWRERAAWVGLAFVPSSMLLGVTTYITTDLAPMPLLWVVPLALYLLTFTLVFAGRPLLPHALMVFFQPSVLAVVALPFIAFWVQSPMYSVPLHLSALFVTAMVCHGELARRRPPVRHLTEFYLWISVGGALGGVFNALLAPVLFPRVWEYPLILVAACLARPWPQGKVSWKAHLWMALRAAGFAVALLALLRSGDTAFLPVWAYITVVAGLLWLLSAGLGRSPLWLALCLGSVVLYRTVDLERRDGSVYADRSFFGHFKVIRVPEDGGLMALYHGSTLHGAQSVRPERRGEPMTYYVRSGPLGQLMASRTLAAPGRPRRVAAVGLGTGTTAVYAEPGEPWDFYEIDPGIERLARDRRFFTYLTDSPGRIRVVQGDARLSLAHARDQYDVILLDAFSSDAIPTHLLTREAVATYLDRLAPGGVIAFHISNRYLDLEPVVAAVARDHGLAARVSTGPAPESRRSRYESISTWVVVARSEADLGSLARARRWRRPELKASVPAWSDDHTSLLNVLDFRD